MTVVRKFIQHYSRRRFVILFYSLLATMLAAPIFSAIGMESKFLEIFLAFNIAAAGIITLLSLHARLGLVLLTLVVAIRIGYAVIGYDPLLLTSQGISDVILFLSLFIMLEMLFTEGPVDSERIFAALNVYLLIGVICGVLFYIIEYQWPGSFHFNTEPLDQSRQSMMPHMLYFSFVTLATLGYGDITPVAGPARALAVVETVSGQIYLVVVVARLVSLYQSRTDAN